MRHTFLFVMISTIAACTCQAIAEQVNSKSDLRTQNQQERLDNIESQVAVEQQGIENEFFRDIALLQESAEYQANRLKMSDRILWTAFIKMSFNEPYADIYATRYLEADFVYPEIKRPRKLVAAMESYYLRTMADFLLDNNVQKLLSSIVNSTNETPQNRTKAQRLLTIVDELQLQYNLIQNRRTARLADLEQWAKDQKENVDVIIGEIQKQPNSTQRGVVIAINYGDKKPFCMIDDEIAYEGSIIGNIKVAKIQRYTVDFEKGGKKWTQRIGKPADSVWGAI
ncbi:MAG: hypothetical protein NTW55_02990 [Planctomycetota bacterium]|nr:hypothetical protein [Planctomycetota bacterium]